MSGQAFASTSPLHLPRFPYTLSQRLKVSFGKRHRHAWALRPSPQVAHRTPEETLATSVDLNARAFAARTGAASHQVMPRSASVRRTTSHRYPGNFGGLIAGPAG